MHHVTQGPGFLVIAGTRADAQFFTDCDLNMIDGLAVPEFLENRVREPEHQNVLHGLFAQIMVDAEDLLLVGVASQFAVESVSGSKVMTERLLHNDALEKRAIPMLSKQSRLVQLFSYFAELAR